MKDSYKHIGILLDVYTYNHAWKIAEHMPDFPEQSRYLLEMLKERRELNIDFVFEHEAENHEIKEMYGFSLISNSWEEELLANYIMDLEAKVKNGDIIDFVRAVSPILYRLFFRLLKDEIPDIKSFIHDTKNEQYDTWLFMKMKQSNYPIFEKYLKVKREGKVTSKSLVELLQFTRLPKSIKKLAVELRNFEKSVRNPLAHLIKPFDEEELYRTTNFSSQTFLNKIIQLAQYSGINYNRKTFYYDQVNEIIKEGLSR